MPSWTKCPNVTISPDASYDSNGVLTPRVVRLPDRGYRMYYMGASPMNAGTIFSAFSDDLENWQKEPGIRIDREKNDMIERVLAPDIIKISENFWRMYYEAHLTNKKRVILSAVSEDLLNWSREAGVRVKSKVYDCGAPKCIRLENGSYRLFFYSYPRPFKSGINSGNHIISALSCDGITFELENGIRIPQDCEKYENYTVYAPEIVRTQDDSWLMYFSGWNSEGIRCTKGRIFSATSKDSFHWTKDKSIVINNGGIYDYRFASEPCIIRSDEGNFVMFYEACDANGVKRILKAVQT